MKKMKKLLALVLAMMMAFSLMAVTAAYDAEEHEHECAVCYEDEGIMPLYEVGRCPWCGGLARYQQPDTQGRIWVWCLETDVCGRSGWL